MQRLLLVLTLATLSVGCANPSTKTSRADTDASYQSAIRVNERQAQAWRDIGNDRQAQYYDERAQHYRDEYSKRNSRDSDDLLGDLLFAIIFGD